MNSLQLEPTLAPQETVRAERAPSADRRELPSLSVDLRVLSLGAGEGGASDLEVRALIGEGGMGRVLLARQHSLTRDVAVKTTKADAGDSARIALLLEGAITGSLEHPSIVPVHALGLDATGLPAMVMKRIEGVTWDTLLADTSHANWEGWDGTSVDRLPGHLQILTQVCNALSYAHSRGVVHRDVKLQNVLIGKFGDVYVADWGVAARAGEVQQTLCGTPAYLAPEMVNGGAVDERTDVYLLGATLHVLLTGQMRHPGSTVTDALLHARTSTPFTYGADVPEELGTLANEACHLEPSQRPASARAFRDALNRYVKHRAAKALADEARARLAELQRVLGDEGAEAGRVERLLSEARFGLEQSLAQWPENPSAKDALGTVERILAERHARMLALESEAREHDPRLGIRWRTIGLGGTAMMSTIAAMTTLLDYETPTARIMLAYPVIITGLITLGAMRFKREFLSTRFDRQVFALLLIGLLGMSFGRTLALFVPMDPADQVIRDSWVLAAVAAVAAVNFLPWVWPVAVLFVGSAVWSSVAPQHAIRIFSWCDAISLWLAALASWRTMRRSADREGLAPRA